MTFPSHFFKPAPSPSRSLRLLQLVALLALVGLASTVVADPSVTSATCANRAGWCANASTVVFTGTGFTSAVEIGFTAEDKAAITCTGGTLSADATSYTCLLITDESGEYPVYMAGTYVGNLLIGTFYKEDSLKDTPFNKNGVETQYMVSSQSSAMPASGDNYTLYGNFSKHTTYKFIIFNYEHNMSMSTIGLPTCESVVMDTDDHNALTCVKLTATSLMIGVYGVLVQDLTTKRYLPGSAFLEGFVVIPPKASLATGSGDCAGSSRKCVTGATLTLTGQNYNVRQANDDPYHDFYVNFSIGFPGKDSGIACNPTAVSGDDASGTISCTLSISSSAKPGNYPIYILNMIQHRGENAPPQHIGNLLYGTYYEWNPPGFNNALLPDDLVYRVTGISETTVAGGSLTIYGYFPMSGSVNVLLYNTEAESEKYDVNLPTCAMATFSNINEDSNALIRPNAVTCTLSADPTQMGAYGFVVQDATTGWYYPGSTTLTPFVIMRNATVSSVTGACVDKSRNCVTGATLTLTGKEINVRQPVASSSVSHFVSFRIGFTEETDPKKAITCATTSVSGSASTSQTVTCQLTVGENATYGMYPIYMFNQVTYAGLKDSGAHVGNLIYGTYPEWDPVGYNNAPLPDSSAYMVTGQDGTIFDHLGTVTIFGSFPHSTPMNVHFYNLDAEMAASNNGDIGCGNVQLVSYGTTSDLADTNAIACSISTNAGKMGTYRFMVEDATTGWIYPGSANLDGITILHRDANVHSVSFTCPNGASSCTTGGVLNFTGDHLNVHVPPSESPYPFYINFFIDYINPNYDDDETTKITCTTTSIGGGYGNGYATCVLNFGLNAAPGTYPIYAINYASDRGVMHTPAMVGSLVVGKDGTVSTARPWLSNTDSTYQYNVTALAPPNAPEGTTVTLFGNFNTSATYTVTFNRVDGSADKTPTCSIQAVTKRSIRCTMASNGATASGSVTYYPMVQDGDSKTYLKTSLTDTHTVSLSSSSSKGNGRLDDKPFVATLAVMIVFIVLFLCMVVLLIVLCCCCEVRRKSKRASHFGDYHDEEWNNEMVANEGNKLNSIYEEGPTLDSTAVRQLLPSTQDASGVPSTVGVNPQG